MAIFEILVKLVVNYSFEHISDSRSNRDWPVVINVSLFAPIENWRHSRRELPFSWNNTRGNQHIEEECQGRCQNTCRHFTIQDVLKHLGLAIQDGKLYLHQPVAFLVSSLSSSFRTSKKALLRWDNFLKQYQQEVCILIAKSCPMFAKRQVIFMSPILSLAINFFSCWRELSSVISCQIMMGIFYVSTRGKCVIVRVFKNFDTTFGKFLSVNCSIAVLKPAGCIFQRFGGREIFRLLTCFIVSMQVK